MRIPKKRRWPKNLPKQGSQKAKAIAKRLAENAAIDKKIEAMRKAVSK